MKIIHAGDIHLDPRQPQPALQSLQALVRHAEQCRPAAVLLAGDLFDRAVPATEQHGMSALIDVMADLSAVAPVVAMPGTPTHDVAGAYDPLRPWITVLDADTTWFGDLPGLLITASMEPRILAEDGADTDLAEANALARARQQLVDARERGEASGNIHVHMHHGAIAAAESETGWYATGAPGELCLTPSDLDLPGARYVALGHIHKLQRIEHINSVAWYCGSAYPVDWGERDRKAALLVTLHDSGSVHVRGLPYGHRPRFKVKLDWSGAGTMAQALESADSLHYAKGSDIWLKMTHPAEYKPQDADRTALRIMLERAGGPEMGSHRIDLRAAPRETVVRADLSEISGWDEQLARWCEATKLAPPRDSQRDLALNLQRQTAGPTGGQPRAWRTDHLTLRGARGIAGGSLDLDLVDYPAGLLAIAGPNGAGKTTLLEHMCPWPAMLTRGGSLSSAFTGKGEAGRIVSVTDAETGLSFDLSIMVSGSGKRTHQIIRRTDEGIIDVLGDTTTASYVAEIERMFGDRSTYITGSIQTQRPISLTLRNPDGSSSSCTSDLILAPAGMRRTLLRSIMGLEQYQHARSIASARVREHEEHHTRILAQIDAIPAADHEAHGVHADAAAAAERAATSLTLAKEAVRNLKAVEPGVVDAADKARGAVAELSAVRRESMAHHQEASAARGRERTHRAVAADLPKLEELATRLDHIRTQVDDARLQAEQDQLARQIKIGEIETERERRRDQIDRQYDRDMDLWREDRDKIETERAWRYAKARNDHRVAMEEWQAEADADATYKAHTARLEMEAAGLQAIAEDADADVERLSTPGEPCDKCGQPIGEMKRLELLAKTQRTRRDAHQKALKVEHTLRTGMLNHTEPGPAPTIADVDVSDLDAQLTRLPEPNRRAYDYPRADLDKRRHEADQQTDAEQRVEQLRGQLREEARSWDVRAYDDAKAAAAKVEAAAAEAERAEARLRDAREREKRLLADEGAWEAAFAEHRKLQSDLAAAREDDGHALRAHSAAVADLTIAKERLEREVANAERRAKLDEAAAEVVQRLTDARMLVTALSPTGIQALLLESAAPQIAADANAMLADSFGDHLQIRLEMVKPRADKLAEDLRIVVTDTTSTVQPSDDQLGPGEQLAETLSGGEATWVRAALAGALALARARHTGQRQLTALLDEADGALSEDARPKYFDLLESVHQRLGRHHTIVVTHSQEILDRLGPERTIRLGG